jgi:acetyl-CoA acetyltransferase
VVGVYTTDQGRNLPRTAFSLELEAIKGALEDAGLTIDDVDAVVPMSSPPHFSATMQHHFSDHQFWAEQLGGRPLNLLERGGASGAVTKAALAIAAGLCEVVVVSYGKSGYSVGPSGAPVPDRAPRVAEFDTSLHGASYITWYALWAQRYMHEFGATAEDLARVAVAARRFAALNPQSVMGSRGELTVDDVVNSRMICNPLHLYDCALDTDGGYALVITSPEVARQTRKTPVWVIGGAESVFTDFYLSAPDPWFPKSGAAVRRCTDTAFAMSGVTRDDIDVAGLYDCFTITLLRNLEEMGFCGIGEGAAYVAEGHISLGGKMPVNTDGGLLSNSHNGDPAGMHTIEVVRQLRGECGERQTPDAKIGVSLQQGYTVHGLASTVIMARD